jgi:hypothetical protein
MEDILTQKFNYASITLYRNYCRLDEKKQSGTTFNDDLDELDEEDDFLGGRMTVTSGELTRNQSMGKIVTIPPKTNNKKTRFFYSGSNLEERIQLNYAMGKNHRFDTCDDRHIKQHFNNPFSEICVNTIERSIRRHGDKITLKLYRHTKHRGFNSIYFRKTTSVQSITYNTKTGNFTTLNMEMMPKKNSKHFRTNNFNSLENVIMRGGILDMRTFINKEYRIFPKYAIVFDNRTFMESINNEFKFNQQTKNKKNTVSLFSGIEFIDLLTNKFIEDKKIKVSDNPFFWIKKFYPTEKYLKKNDRKLIASILDMFKIKSKVTIKLMHENNLFDIYNVSLLCYLFGDNFSKYVGSIDPSLFQKSKIDISDNTWGNIKMFVNDNINHSFKISNIEKENIVKIINKLTDKISIGKRFISELVDHFNMIHKLRTYYPDLYLKSRTYDEFHNEHLELSKMMSLIKKGWVVEYQFVDKMVDDVEKPIDVKINLGESELLVDCKELVGEITFYPHILKREEEFDEEGKFMHHCVASYSDKDRSIIISIRTEDKQDRVTCEFDCQTGTLMQAKHFCNRQPPGDMELAIEKLENKTKYYARMGLLHSLEKKKVLIKINGIEIDLENREPRRVGDILYDMRNNELAF